MSTIAISYRSLDNASSEAKGVAKKLNNYADSIEKTVYKKLNSYDGEWTSNIRSASNSASKKIGELRDAANSYSNYANDIKSVKDECKRVDKAVRSEVSNLTTRFKQANGIKNSWIENTFYFIANKIDNSNAVTRWIDDGVDQIKAKTDSFLDKIEQWYDYEGGKKLIVNSLVAILEFVVGVVSVILAIGALGAAIASGAIFGIVAAVAGIVSGVIAAVNGIANLINEQKAYYQTNVRDNPAYGARRSKINSIQDWLRTDTDSKFWHGVATVIDITDGICAVIGIVSGVSDLVKNGYKWATGNTKPLEKITKSDIFSKDTWRAFKTKLSGSFKDVGNAFKGSVDNLIKGIKQLDFSSFSVKNIGNIFKDGISDLSKIIKKGDFVTFGTDVKSVFKDGLDELLKGIKKADFTEFKLDVKSFTSDFASNLKGYYWDFSKKENKLNSIKNLGDMAKDLLDDGASGMEIIGSVFPVTTFEEKLVTDNDSASWFANKEIWNTGKDIMDLVKNTKELLNNTIWKENYFTGSKEVLKKLNERSSKNVSLSNIYIPTVA